MSLSAKYQQFLANPSTAALAEKASIHYITTLTTINEPTAIIKHLSAQSKQLEKKSEKVLSAIESSNGLCLDVETTLEFIFGGGAFLPGLDDNFLADRTVTFPVVHIVQFDNQQKITQVRLYWDQGSLLKQIDVIGARARNWPIRDGKDQARLIASSSSFTTNPPSTTSSRRSTASRDPNEVVITDRPTSSRSSISVTGDPHASLSLFQPRDTNQESSFSRPIAPRAQSAKPPPRDYSELFAGEDPESPTPSVASPSPRKNGIPVKAGGGKNFANNRLFEGAEEEQGLKSPGVKTNAKKYNHFEFGEGNDDQSTPKVRETARSTKSKHTSQWGFEDFVTPEKPGTKVLGQSVRHFGWSDDEDEGSPVPRPIVHQARPDADHHFEFNDDGTPVADRRKEVTSKGRKHNAGLGLYKDHILHSTSDDENRSESPKGDNKRPLGNVTMVINNENRKKDFGSQWEMTDASPNPARTANNGNENGNGNAKHISEDRQKVLNGLDAHWGLYEDSPEQSKKENVNGGRGIKASGDGMGRRKDAAEGWSIGNEGGGYKGVRPKGGAKEPESKGNFWDF
ncbi:hypothetical protein AOQ84DRAFT_437484 [Glonium stellatum]|uniref:NTF2-like protein n=1 Tax=Glonium stellatum TaxID=574774 RepID=A0A8E2F706_9PEZI|nr:hypothetical protein AOQ84DRAFT_437484 [Glonium stellatum]